MQQLGQISANIHLGYWAIRGLGQPIRFLLAFVEEPIFEIRLGANADGTLMNDRSLEHADWDNHKSTLQFAFPNLPYLIDSSDLGEVRLTQSNAILRYLGRRFDLYGDSEQERCQIDVLQDEAYDYRNCIIEATYVSESEYTDTLNAFVTNAIPRHLDRFQEYLKSSGHTSHFVGQRISLVDFIVYELLWQTSVMVPGSITENNRGSLFKFIESFESIPQIAAYRLSDHYLDRPINSTWTAFN